MRTSLGQSMDLQSAPNLNEKPDLSKFTVETYDAIVKYKTAYYSFYLPVAIAMAMVRMYFKLDYHIVFIVRSSSCKDWNLISVEDWNSRRTTFQASARYPFTNGTLFSSPRWLFGLFWWSWSNGKINVNPLLLWMLVIMDYLSRVRLVPILKMANALGLLLPLCQCVIQHNESWSKYVRFINTRKIIPRLITSYFSLKRFTTGQRLLNLSSWWNPYTNNWTSQSCMLNMRKRVIRN